VTQDPSEEAADTRAGVPIEDDLAGVETSMSRLVGLAKRWLAAVVAAALLIPTGAWLLDELDFRRSGADVLETLEGTLGEDDVAGAILLVRAAGCTPSQGGSGSGFVVDVGDGPVILTNRHVVDGARQVAVRALDGTANARVVEVEVSDVADVAVLRVADPGGLPPALRLVDRPVAVGDDVRLVGFPAARPATTAGTVVEAAPAQLLLELEVVPGASGSPVVDASGHVVGQIHAVTAGGLGLATPAELLVRAARTSEPLPDC
jgi:S1-C subfamily serine protease